MAVRTPAERPVILALTLFDGQVDDACDAQPHQPVRVEFPILVAVAAEPVAAIVVPLVSQAHVDAFAPEGPALLYQSVVEPLVPLARQKRFDPLPTLKHLGSVSPSSVDRVGDCDP